MATWANCCGGSSSADRSHESALALEGSRAGRRQNSSSTWNGRAMNKISKMMDNRWVKIAGVLLAASFMLVTFLPRVVYPLLPYNELGEIIISALWLGTSFGAGIAAHRAFHGMPIFE